MAALRPFRSPKPRPRARKPLWRLAPHIAPWLLVAGLALWRRRNPAPVEVAPQPGMSRQDVVEPHALDAQEPGRGRLAPHPRHIPLHGWKDILWRTVQEINRDRLPRVAGGITFYALLAMAPALAVFVSLYGLFADIGQVEGQLNQMATVIPDDVVAIVGEQMRRLAVERKANLSLAFAVSFALSVWTASNATRALVDAMNIAYDELEKRNVIQLMAVTYAATFGMLVFLLMVTGLLVAAPILLRVMGLGAFEPLWAPLRWVVLLAAAAGAFTLLYRYGPCRSRARWRWVWPGGVLAAGLWLAGSLVFSWFLNNFANYDVTYGSLGAVIAFMMWIWFSVMVVLLGAELNAEIEHQTALDSTTGPEQPLGERGATMADTVGLALTTTLTDALGLAWRGGRDFGRRLLSRLREPAEPDEAAQARREGQDAPKDPGSGPEPQPPSSSSRAAKRAA